MKRDTFTHLYMICHNLPAIIKAYRKLTGCSYKEARRDWFAWNLGLPSPKELRAMIEKFEIG